MLRKIKLSLAYVWFQFVRPSKDSVGSLPGQQPGFWMVSPPVSSQLTTPQSMISGMLLRNLVFLGGSAEKNPPAMQETEVQSPGREDPLEKGMATHSSVLAWRTPWTEEPGGLQSMGSQRVRHDWVTNQQQLRIPWDEGGWAPVLILKSSADLVLLNTSREKTGGVTGEQHPTAPLSMISYYYCY